jgi:hypothetical protein
VSNAVAVKLAVRLGRLNPSNYPGRGERWVNPNGSVRRDRLPLAELHERIAAPKCAYRNERR